MKDCLGDFNNRVAEIEKYFEFVAKIDKVETHKQDPITFSSQETHVIDSDLQRILKSNCYLLLYNLVESSIRNGIIAIYDAIHNDNLTYRDVNDKIQVIWLGYKCDKLTQASISQKSVIKTVNGILKEILENTGIYLEKEKLPISGNLDANVINELINQYGFFGQIRNAGSRIEYVLSRVKDVRNDLAHGNVSFREASQDTVMRELIDYKKELVMYLTDVLHNIDDYVTNKKYQK